MKTIISLLTTMVFVFAFGTAFADDWPTDKKSFKFLGTELQDEGFPVRKAELMKSGAPAESLFSNVGSVDLPDPYRVFAKPTPRVVTGVAAGGLRAGDPDKGSKIFDSLLGERGSKADMNIAY
jgi:hypothetical protein